MKLHKRLGKFYYMGDTICGLTLFPDQVVVFNKKVTCKNCLKILKKRRRPHK